MGECNDMVIAAGGVAPFDGGPDDPTMGLHPGERVASGVFEFTDANDVVLSVDVNNFTVTGPNGPEGVMPRPYSFICPPDVFVGTLDEQQARWVAGSYESVNRGRGDRHPALPKM